MTKTERQGGLGSKALALALGVVAAKLAQVAAEKLWTKGLHRPLPEADDASMANKIAWMGVTAAAVGMARELARELASPLVKDEDSQTDSG
ncbi:MAG: DUF4235 domain-containing protein [Actinobacteria bacterium]|nr:DUF4235 domain-containing protein [Actinomycetota bacterium]